MTAPEPRPDRAGAAAAENATARLLVTPVRGDPERRTIGIIPLVEHRACGTHFPRSAPCPKCGKKLLEG